MKTMNLSKILKFFTPKDTTFYPLFQEYSKLLIEASKLLKVIVKDGATKELVEQMKIIEKKGDKMNYTIQMELNKSFITPFDREDIQSLSTVMDDVLDHMYGAAQKIYLYKPKHLMSEFYSISLIIEKSVEEIDFCINKLSKIDKYKDEIFNSCDRINTLEHNSDEIFHLGISQLFETEIESNEVIKNKGILETLEKTVDYAEDVSDVIQTIIVKSV